MEGGLVFTKYSSGCLRHILLRSKGVKEEIKETHKERGALNEELFDKIKGDAPIAREKPFHFTFSSDPAAYWSGRIDFLLHPDSPEQKKIQELKSTESSGVYKSVIKEGKINSQNLAQVAVYMLAEKCNNAELIVTYYKRNKKTKVLKPADERRFKIDLQEDGLIMVDDNSSGYYVDNLIQHAQAAAKAIQEDRVAGSRPYNASPFDGPCSFCPFSSVCSMFDDGLIKSTDEFVNLSNHVISKAKSEKK